MTMKKYNKSLLKVSSTVSSNLSSGWIGLVMVTPNFMPLNTINNFYALIMNIGLAILSFIIAVALDQKSYEF